MMLHSFYETIISVSNLVSLGFLTSSTWLIYADINSDQSPGNILFTFMMLIFACCAFIFSSLSVLLSGIMDYRRAETYIDMRMALILGLHISSTILIVFVRMQLSSSFPTNDDFQS